MDAILLPAFTHAPETNRVYNVDCLTLLHAMPDKSVDITVTSPPYNIGVAMTHTPSGKFKNDQWVKRFADGYTTYGDDMPEHDYQAWIKNVIDECL